MAKLLFGNGQFNARSQSKPTGWRRELNVGKSTVHKIRYAAGGIDYW